MGPKSFSFPELVAEWNGCHGAFYRLRANDFLWHQHNQTWLTYALTSAAGIPVLLAEATSEGIANGISAKTLWLSLFGKISSSNAHEFLSELEAAAAQKGKTRLSLGGEEFHFLPGLPESDKEILALELTRRGYALADCADFAGDLRNALLYRGEQAICRSRRMAISSGNFYRR